MTHAAVVDTTSLPVPVRRWVDAARLIELGDVETIEVRGTGRVRLGRLPWLPIDHRTRHRLGHDQVREIRLRVGPIPILPVLDAYVDGTGMTRIGPAATVGPEVDQGAFLAMWAEAVAWPRAWSALTGLTWEADDEDHARLRLPFGNGVEIMDVAFDPLSGYPQAFEVDRFKARGRKVRWRAECSDLRQFGRVRSWSHVSATWADDPGPWYEAWFEQIELNAPVGAALERARRAIARARRDGG